MSQFNPFGKPLKNLLAEDLAILRSTSEGWFAEYKSEVPIPSRIARSISSFANQQGGLLFFGVEGDRTGDNFAKSFPGVPVEDWPALQNRITSSVNAHVTPHPFFEARFIRGPDPSLGLPDDKGIIMIRIPLGLDAPYLHSDGRIYRRVADQSQPTHELDRSALDFLWARKEKAEKVFRETLEREPLVSEAEGDMPRLTMFAFADPSGGHRVRTGSI